MSSPAFVFIAVIPSGFEHRKAVRSMHAKADNRTHEAAR
jgi:hypothetical protein